MKPINFQERRRQFLKALGSSVAVLPSAPHVVRNNDVLHPYRQDSNFYYLTGFEEPSSLCLFAPKNKAPFQMFVQPKDKKKELWEGKIRGPAGAQSAFGADKAHPSTPESHFDEAFMEAMAEADGLYYRVGEDAKFDQRIFRLLKKCQKKRGRTGRPLWPIHDPSEGLGEMRLIKSQQECARLMAAAELSAESHVNAMRITKPGMYEYEVEAVIYHSFRVRGAQRLGYPSIVASGANACVLHYTANNRKMMDRDLLLIDAGAEFEYYSADITRTFPVSGKFSKEQAEIYRAVLRAQKEGIRLARPGKTLRQIHEHTVEVLVEELKKLKLLKGPTKSLIQKGAYLSYYPHGTGHWLGMDVHDTGKYYERHQESSRKLRPGMTFTVEPGLYFSADAKCPAKYKGIGVRIEDDVVITQTGCKVLTLGVPKELDEVESLCHQA